VVALTKIDSLDPETLKTQIERLKRAINSAGPVLGAGEKPRAPYKISSIAGDGVIEVLRAVQGFVDEKRRDEAKAAPAPDWRP
jgi:GTP-binding protein